MNIPKIAICCTSPLLQSSLERFLHAYLVDEKHCDFIIADEPLQSHKAICLIGEEKESHIKKPFTQQSLLEDINHFFDYLQHNKKLESSTTEEYTATHNQNSNQDFYLHAKALDSKQNLQPQLEEQIELLCKSFAKQLIELIEKNRV